MYVVNISRIIEKMYGRGYNKSSFSKALNISRNTLATYFNDPAKMPYAVLSEMAKLLCDNEDEAAEIFFVHQLS